MSGTAASAAFLAVLGGAAIAVQNTIMLALMDRGVGFAGALLVNSAVGLLVLAGIETIMSGPAFTTDIATHAKSWFVLPGLLGTFFVFASLYGYRHQGATATIALVVAAQLMTGLGVDAIGLTGALRSVGLHTLIGAALLVLGAALIVR